jgi:hypothetical protein
VLAGVKIARRDYPENREKDGNQPERQAVSHYST